MRLLRFYIFFYFSLIIFVFNYLAFLRNTFIDTFRNDLDDIESENNILKTYTHLKYDLRGFVIE